MTESEASKVLNMIETHGPLPTMAKEMSIKALEKQIPKKPEYIADGYADGEFVYDYAKCPICGHDFEYEINDWGCNYCSNCGQKLDWSDEE